jgi:hypothetical protein
MGSGLTPTLTQLAAGWREEAALYRRRGQANLADLIESLARDLDAALQADRLQVLTLGEASKESGLSYSALEKAVRDGRIPNAGRPGRPRIRRSDLPRKLRRRPQAQVDLADRILAAR